MDELQYYSFLDEVEKEEMGKMLKEVPSVEALYAIREAMQNLESVRLSEVKEALKEEISEEFSLLVQEYLQAKIDQIHTQKEATSIKEQLQKMASFSSSRALAEVKAIEGEFLNENDFFSLGEKDQLEKTLQALPSLDGIAMFMEEVYQKQKKAREKVEAPLHYQIEKLLYLPEEEKEYYLNLGKQVANKKTLELITAEAKERDHLYHTLEFSLQQQEMEEQVYHLFLPIEEQTMWVEKIKQAKYQAELDLLRDHLELLKQHKG